VKALQEQFIAAIAGAFEGEMETEQANAIRALAASFMQDAEAKVREDLDLAIGEKDRRLSELEADAAVGRSYLATLRGEAKETYKRLCAVLNQRPEVAILTAIDTGSMDFVRAFRTSQGKQLDAQFPLACSKCGNTELTRRNSKNTIVDGTPEGYGIVPDASGVMSRD
jgi:hypothetical protein